MIFEVELFLSLTSHDMFCSVSVFGPLYGHTLSIIVFNDIQPRLGHHTVSVFGPGKGLLEHRCNIHSIAFLQAN